MSADLWAAFGDAQPAENPWATQDEKEKHANNDLANSTVSLSNNISSISGTAANVPLASNSTLTSPDDPWASIDALSAAAKSSKITSVPVKAISALPEDDWSDFESAVPSLPATSIPQTRSQSFPKEAIDDGWSAFEAASPPPASLPPETREESTFSDAEIMWDADEALEPSSSLSSPNKPRTTLASPVTPTSAFIDLSGISNLAVSAQQPQADILSDTEDDFGDFEQAEGSEPVTIPMPVSELLSEPASAPPTILSMPVAEPRITTATVPAAIMQNRIETRGTGADGLIFGATQKASALPQIQMIDPAPQSAPPPGLTRTRTISAADKLKPLPPDPPLITPTPEAEKTEDDYFDDWDDIASPSVPPGATAPTLQPVSSTATTGATPSNSEDLITTMPDTSNANTSNTDPAPSALPPSNIPPPSILLSHLSTSVLPKLANPSSQAAPNPVLRTAAHILAGRKHRWKRDTHLAQSMSISAAGGAGVKSGMKLTGVDRAETAREDRDAAELLRVYKAKSGALRAAANRAADGIGDGKGVVELRDGAPIRVEKAGPTKAGNAKGSVAVAAASGGKPCVICGLRRAERVAGVDVDVYDGFGEWWVEHWGHKECKLWWEMEEAALRSK